MSLSTVCVEMRPYQLSHVPYVNICCLLPCILIIHNIIYLKCTRGKIYKGLLFDYTSDDLLYWPCFD